MPALKDSPDTLTFGEAIERLKKNPDDPELQELRKTFGSFKKQFIPSQKELAAIAKSVSSIVEQSAVLQSITQVQENAKRLTTFFDSFRVNDAISQLQQAQAWQNGPTHLLSIPPSSEVETQIKLDEVNSNLERIFELLEKNSQEKDDKQQIGLDLLLKIPAKNKRYKIHRKIAGLYLDSLRADNFQIFRRMQVTYLTTSRKRLKVTFNYYQANRKNNNKKIKYALRYLKGVANKLGYTFRFHSEYTDLVRL